ncbi:MAG: hypothetical protein JEZ06_06915 [Anaerolineaceae bacterium]|nr:hypothetical protein [Anaerolineaceae bacterium]
MNPNLQDSQSINPINKKGKHYRLPVPVRLIASLGAFIIIGTLLMCFPSVGSIRPLSLPEALFTAVSALTCTGLSILTPAVDLSVFGQVLLLILIQLGGIGYITLAITIFRLLGLKISMVDRITLRDQFGVLRTGAILEFAQQVLLTVLAIEALGTLLLWLHWRSSMGDLRALWFAAFHAISAFCNAGFDLFNGLQAYPEGIPNDIFTLFVMGSLITLGSMGFPIISNLLHFPKSRKLTLHTRLTLIIILTLTILGSIMLITSESILPEGVFHGESLSKSILLSTYQIISTRTAGFAGFSTFQQISSAGKLILMVFMFIGSSPASMGGGLKTGALITLLLLFRGFVRGQKTISIYGRTISREQAYRALAVLLASLLVIISMTWFILLTNPTDLETALFEVISAFATCGYSMGLTTQLNTAGLILMIITMFWGKLGALTIVSALTGRQKEILVHYPEENILIG